MAPAQTKIPKDAHGIHLSLAPVSVSMTSDKPKTMMRSLEDVSPHKMWLNLPRIPSLDAYLSQSPLDISASSALPPFVKGSASQCEKAVRPSLGSLFNFLSLNRRLRDSYQDDSVLPGVLDMFLIPVPDQNGQEPCPLHGSSAAPDCGPDSEDVRHSSIHLANDCTPVSRPTHLLTQEEAAGMGCPHSSSADSNEPVFEGVLEETVKVQAQWHLARQADLQSRALRLQRTLQAQLGHHAVQHCSRQLGELLRHCPTETASLDSLSPGKHLAPAGSKLRFPERESSGASSYRTELSEFGRSSAAVLRCLRESLDSEATATSSSDEEPEDDRVRTGSSSPVGSSCDERWLEERAELGSRWSWLQLRTSELQERIKQMGDLHQCIKSSKRGVVLAECQPLTDRQIQQSLLTDVAGLSSAALDQDNEYCCPARLLQNIERQSAELNYIVNSLKIPLSFSPLSKQPQTQKGKRRFTSAQRKGRVFVLGNSRRWRPDESCVCARTRPLVTYHKPKLFTFSPYNPSNPQDSENSTSTHSSSWDPTVLHADPDCCSTRTLPSSFSLHPALPLSGGPKNETHSRHHKDKFAGLSPIRLPGCAQKQHSRAFKRKRKTSSTTTEEEDKDEVLHQLYNPVKSLHDVLEKSNTQSSQVFVHSFQGECDDSIDVTLPESQTKVDKLHNKDILTPSWRVVSTQCLMKTEAGEAEGQVEVLTDKVFAQRHLELERREKLLWSTRGISRRLKRGIWVYTSAVKSAWNRSGAQLETHQQPTSQDDLPQAQWEPRVFPLDDEGEALLSSSSESVCPCCVSSTSKNI